MNYRPLISIIIPSYRFDNDQIKIILSLKYPDYVEIEVIVVVDNPDFIIDTLDFKCQNLKIIFNSENYGASISRNIGLKASKGDWILFLDDDIIPNSDLLFEYSQFIIKENASFVGAVGLVEFPDPINTFTEGIIYSGMLECFYLARKHDYLLWGVSANILISKECIDGLEFSSDFPIKGGGEDIDLFLRIIKRYPGKTFFSCPNAIVRHPWWKKGKRDYNRFFRWAYGDSILPSKFPEFRFYSYPNLIELIFIITIFSPLLGIIKYFSIILFTIAIELIGETFKNNMFPSKNILIKLTEALFIRSANDLGRFLGNILHYRFILFERFDFLLTKGSNRPDKKWFILKLVILLTFIAFLYL